MYTYVRSLPKQAYIYPFWDATIKERRPTNSLRNDAKLFKEKYYSCLGDRLQEILKLNSKRSQDSQELAQGKAQFLWVSYFSRRHMLGTILKITSSPDTRSKDCLSGDEDSKEALLSFVRGTYESKDDQRR